MTTMRFLGAALLVWTVQAAAADKLTSEMIRELMDTTDTAAAQRDAATIGAALGDNFYKYVDVPSDGLPATVRITKQQYLDTIEKGWEKVGKYDYRRKDVVINLSSGGDSGESFSTIVENFEIDGKSMTSKVREYARYELQDGRPVIVNLDTQTLVGDTTPEQ